MKISRSRQFPSHERLESVSCVSVFRHDSKKRYNFSESLTIVSLSFFFLFFLLRHRYTRLSGGRHDQRSELRKLRNSETSLTVNRRNLLYKSILFLRSQRQKDERGRLISFVGGSAADQLKLPTRNDLTRLR